ncbi:MAG: hypothetical protein JWO94_1351 [Verrucomicrobiaceae bacterium]|nr:hypothetical protein [Verrucomicrobiaceae bacterium]
MNWQKIVGGLVAVVVVWAAVWLLMLFMAAPDQQMLRMHGKFITALEQRKWGTVDALVSKDYNDGVQDAATVKASMRKVLAGFYVLSITPEVVSAKAVPSQGGKIWLGMVSTKLKVEGNGAGISAIVVSESRRMTKPWIFHWHKRGFWPWSWELMQIHNDGLLIPDGALEMLGTGEK